jgi:hypothetical protein
VAGREAFLKLWYHILERAADRYPTAHRYLLQKEERHVSDRDNFRQR